MLLTLDEIFEEFADLERQDQSLFLLELGDELPELPDDARTDANRVHGCQSQVWLITEIDGTGEEATFSIKADSDSNIVRGLIAILIASYNGKTARQILEYDVDSVFQRLNLQQHITPQRRNGLRGMVDRVLTLARMHLATCGVGDAVPVRVSSTASNPACSSLEPISKELSSPALNGDAIRQEFPALCRPLSSGSRPIFLDSGASAQKPQFVIDKEREVEEQYYANAHRGTYEFGLRIDQEFEGSRTRIANFIGAASSANIIFTPSRKRSC